MVFTLTAAMLVGTPLTASAAPLNSVYQVTDRWGETTEQENSSDTRTGTVTGSETNSGVLAADSVIVGISLDETNVSMEMGAYDPAHKVEKVLTASIDWSEEADADLETKLLKSLTWETGERDIVALRAMGTGKDALNDKMTLVAKKGGTTTVTVRLDSDEYNIHYSATATVTVEQYASKLSFSEELGKDAYEDATLKLDDYLVREPISATDKVTYVLKSQGKDTKATLKNGVLTLKLKQKYTEGKDYKVTVVAVGKNVKSEDTEIVIKKAVPATSVTITSDDLTINNKKADWLVNQKGTEIDLDVTVDPEGCTDKVTWTSQKPAVVAVKYKDPKDGSKGVTLTAKGVGSSKITAKAGKKQAYVTVTVRANLTDVEITTSDTELYSGQTIQLTANQKFENGGTVNFTDAGLNWVFDGGDEGTTTEKNKRISAMKKVASLNAKTGVLTIKPDLGVSGAPADKKIKIKVQNAKKIGKTGEPGYTNKVKSEDYDSIEFDLTQINVKDIAVWSNTLSSQTPNRIAWATLKNGSPKDMKSDKDSGVKANNTVNIANDTSRTYRVVVDAEFTDGRKVPAEIAAKVIGWSSKNTKLVTVDPKGNTVTVKAIKKGKSTITASSATLKKNSTTKYTAIKATFNANVTVPTKSITLSVKNQGIGWKNANQNVKVTAKLDKGTTNKAKEIVWNAKGVTKDGEAIAVASADVKNGTLKLKKGNYNVGDVYTVTAKLPGTGVQTSIKVKIVEPTKKVQIVQNADSNEKFKNNKTQLYLADDETLDLVTKVQKNGESTWVIPTDENNRAVVTYTVKGDCVQLIGDQDKVIKVIKVGKATITAKTSDGKTAKLTVEVKAGNRPQ